MPYNTWKKQDKALFLDLHKKFGINFSKYEPYFLDRTKDQIKSFYYNQIQKIKQLKIKQQQLSPLTPVASCQILFSGSVNNIKVQNLNQSENIQDAYNPLDTVIDGYFDD
ncbi:SANT/Myb_domain [Hexamita inflata]|uniref:SANT/Myb domain n=1 Tax=Hexamita inflata TaxID=28002 RepID=A0AA86UIS5_9EUKA|nr:SANT/Myb domain [Hexamita inflata]